MSNLKLGSAGWGFREMSIREYFDTAARLGLTLVELNCREDVPNHAQADFDKQDITEVQDCATDEGLEIVALSTSSNFAQSDPSILNSEVAQLRRTIELANDFKARYVRTTISQNTNASPAAMETALRKLQEAGQFADSFNIKLAIENGSALLGSISQCLNVMEQLKAEPIGLVFNPACFARDGDDPIKALESLGEHVCYAHLADWNGQDFCAVDQGRIDWEKVLTLLVKHDVELALIEYPHPDDIELGTAASHKKLTSLLHRLGGKSH